MNKSFIATFIAALLALSNAERDASERFLRRGGGGRGDKLAKLQSMIETECTASFSCPTDTPSIEECTFEKPDRPVMTGWTDQQKEDFKEEIQAMKQQRKQQLLTCACCGKFTLAEMKPKLTDGSGSVEGRPGMSEGGSRGGGLRESVVVENTSIDKIDTSASADGSTSADP